MGGREGCSCLLCSFRFMLVQQVVADQTVQQIRREMEGELGSAGCNSCLVFPDEVPGEYRPRMPECGCICVLSDQVVRGKRKMTTE